MNASLIEGIVLYAVPAILAITLHEAAHGYVAKLFGDATAYMLGRVTANPIKHIDPVGTLLVPLVTYALGAMAGRPGFFFGWAKPVPVNFQNLRHPRRDSFLVAAAGPGANVLMALGWAILVKINHGSNAALHVMGWHGIWLNLVLGALNLLPVLPLDGGRLVSSVLPPRLSVLYGRLEQYGLFIVLALLALNVLWVLLEPMVQVFLSFIQAIVGPIPA